MKSDRFMKILYLLHTSQWHGATISFFYMLEGLINKYKIQPYVFIPVNQKNINKEFKKKIMELNCKVIYGFIGTSVIYDSPTLKNVFFYFLNFIFRIFSFIQIFFISIIIRPNIIHTNVGIIREGFFVSKLLRIKHIWHLREYQDLDFNWEIKPSKNYFCSLLNQSYVIAITDGIANHFHLSRNYKVIYNPIQKEFLNSKVIKKEKFFLISNRISYEKGIEDILSAFSEFKKTDKKEFKLIIAGNGQKKYVSFLKEKVKQLNIEDFVNFVGYQKNLIKLQSESTAVIVGSFFEGFGRMTAEAILNYTLVIGRDSGGTKEIIKKTGGGMLFSNIMELASQMQIISHLVEEDDYNIIIYRANKEAKKLFSYDNCIEKIWDFYN